MWAGDDYHHFWWLFCFKKNYSCTRVQIKVSVTDDTVFTNSRLFFLIPTRIGACWLANQAWRSCTRTLKPETRLSICSESIPHCTVQTCHVPPLKLRQGDTACFEAAATDEISGGNEWVFQPPWLTRLDGVPRRRWETGAKNIVLKNQSPLKCSFNWHNKARITAGPPFRLLLVA